VTPRREVGKVIYYSCNSFRLNPTQRPRYINVTDRQTDGRTDLLLIAVIKIIQAKMVYTTDDAYVALNKQLAAMNLLRYLLRYKWLILDKRARPSPPPSWGTGPPATKERIRNSAGRLPRCSHHSLPTSTLIDTLDGSLSNSGVSLISAV